MLANFIATFPGVVNTTTTTSGSFVAECSNPAFDTPACVVITGASPIVYTTTPLTCSSSGALTCTAAGASPGCCKRANTDPFPITQCTIAGGVGNSPVCVLSGAATVVTTTVTTASIPGFFTENCGMVPGGCIACFHCCKQAFGKDDAAVLKCEKSFCNTVQIFSRHALHAALPRAVAACRAKRVARA